MRVLVTGGTGYLGTSLCRTLKKQGHQVRAVSRQTGGDITRPETLESCFEGVQAVFHLAGLVQTTPGAFDEINIRGLENVLGLCLKYRIKRVVYVSSFTIFGPSPNGPWKEESIRPRETFFHDYERTKYLGYEVAKKWRRNVPLNIAFPTVIFGPGPFTQGNLMTRVFRRWLRFKIAVLPAANPVWNLVYVDDVAEGLTRMLAAPAGEDFILGGKECSMKEIALEFSRLSGRQIHTLNLPGRLLWLFSYLEEFGARLAGQPPLVSPKTFRFFVQDWKFSSQKARTVLSYSPRPLQEGLKSTISWMKDKAYT